MNTKDFLPKGWTELAEWFQNFADKLQILSAKYSVPPTVMATVNADNLWLKY